MAEITALLKQSQANKGKEALRASGVAWTKYIPHLPHPKQRIALASDAIELFYGGAAGGGKSDYLLMAALQYVDKADYKALLLRRTFADLSLPSALMDRSHEWLDDTDAHWNGLTKSWDFPSGAKVAFGYLESENDKYRYRSAEFQFIGFDEVAQFSESQYSYLFSRLRRLRGSDVPLRIRSASNPDGEGYEWVQNRFIPQEYIDSIDDAKNGQTWSKGGAVFVPSLLEDNPSLDTAEYDEALIRMSLDDPVLYDRLRWGKWGLMERGTLILSDWFPRARYFDKLPDDVQWQARAYDLAVGKHQVVPDEKRKRKGDYHATALGANDLRRGVLWLGKPEMWREDISLATKRIVGHMISETSLRHGVGSSNFEATIVSGLRADGFPIEEINEGRSDKVSRSSFWRNMAAQGRVYLVGSVEEWKPFMHYWLAWQGKDSDVDDCIDVVSDLALMFGLTFTADHSPRKRRAVYPKLAALIRGKG